MPDGRHGQVHENYEHNIALAGRNPSFSALYCYSALRIPLDTRTKKNDKGKWIPCQARNDPTPHYVLWRAGDGGRRTEGRNQRTEGRERRTEGRGRTLRRTTCFGGQATEGGGRKTDDGRQKAEDRRQRTEDR